jgi:hypothetical protein
VDLVGQTSYQEVWDYDDARMVQRLVRLIALCPAYHEVKHLGLAGRCSRLGPALAHLAPCHRLVDV